jgi:glucose/arabinose dehydrogenase
MKFIKQTLSIALLALAGQAVAQQPQAQPVSSPQQNAQQQLTPEQQAQVTKQNAQMIQTANKVVQLIDQGKVVEAWSQASLSAKQVVTQDSFVNTINADRKRLGAVQDRKQTNITRVVYRPGGKVPAGYYINISYTTKFAGAKQPVGELVSFHLDDDKVWRLSGYTLR